MPKTPPTSSEYTRLGNQASSFEGDRVKMDDIIGDDIELQKFVIQKSQFKDNDGNEKDCAIMQIKHEGATNVVISGAMTLISALRQLDESKLPVTIKIDRGRSAKGRNIYEVFLKG